ncbi:hypothetical protein [Burkholderia gladioli]|uniref:hypothetical protein n=1 Tax=Burkholderia gladioli TaxID=28095 RepID=UPI003D21EC39
MASGALLGMMQGCPAARASARTRPQKERSERCYDEPPAPFHPAGILSGQAPHRAPAAPRRAHPRVARGGWAALWLLAVLPAAHAAHADGVDLAAARFQSLLSCQPGARSPLPAERAAWREAGLSITGYAHDGGVLIDDRREDPADRWEEMRVRFPRPVTIEGNPVSVVHLARQQSGDTDADLDLSIYAETSGDVAAFAAARRLAALPSAVPAGLDISNNQEDGHVAGFHAGYLRWTAPLSKREADALAEPGSTYLPGAHRLPRCASPAPWPPSRAVSRSAAWSSARRHADRRHVRPPPIAAAPATGCAAPGRARACPSRGGEERGRRDPAPLRAGSRGPGHKPQACRKGRLRRSIRHRSWPSSSRHRSSRATANETRIQTQNTTKNQQTSRSRPFLLTPA